MFPLFNTVFNPGKPNFFGGLETINGTGTGIFDLLTAPWFFSVLPMHYFDGMVLGAPYLLVLCPLLLLDPGRRRWLGVASVVLIYYLFWFFMLSQQVRFLIQVSPMITAMASVGAVAIWTRTQGILALRSSLAAVLLVLALNQFIFVAAYAAARLPVALGLISAFDFHTKTPTMGGAHFVTCSYISKNLKPNQKYFVTFNWVFYYCPQVSAVANGFPENSKWWLDSETPDTISRTEFVNRLSDLSPRYFLTSKGSESRRNISGKAEFGTLADSDSRFGPFLAPVFRQLKPLSEDRFTAVYDGRDVIRLLRQLNN